VTELENDYDAVIVSVPHALYIDYNDEYFVSITKEHGVNCGFKRSLPWQR
jgi:hypothetical protein